MDDEIVQDHQERNIEDNLKQACIEMKLIREGKFPKKSWNEVYRELKEEEIYLSYETSEDRQAIEDLEEEK